MFLIIIATTIIIVTVLLVYIGFVKAEPIVLDENLKIQKVVEGLEYPTSMAFLGPDDFLVTEQKNGTVRRVINGNLVAEPLLDENVIYGQSQGMFGIAILEKNGHTYVYVSFLASNADTDVGYGRRDLISKAPDNVLYRYELLNDSMLANPLLMRNVSSLLTTLHYGGTVVVGPDMNIYHVIGDNGFVGQGDGDQTRAQNVLDGDEPNGTGGISIFTFNGSAPHEGILGHDYPLNHYYAYGIRNSFGLAFDPVTNYLWDTENGPDYGDEINLVLPGFNSGWNVVQGNPDTNLTKSPYDFDPVLSVYKETGFHEYFPVDYLETFGGRGKYKDPSFEWKNSQGVTAITFLNSSKLGNNYRGDMFVGNVMGGIVYHFELMPDRMSLALNGPLQDGIADSPKELDDVIFAKDFGSVTDIKEGPDGYLYIVSYLDGSVYRIVPKTE